MPCRWTGRLNGQEGEFPSNFVKILEEGDSPQQVWRGVLWGKELDFEHKRKWVWFGFWMGTI
jgi:hypothetical protein